MTRYLVTMSNDVERQRARKMIDAAPVGARVEIKAAKRSLPQNDKMWACLSDVAQQVEWHGKKLTPDDWKIIFLDALNREHRMVPSLDGLGWVDLGRRSSDLGKDEMSDLIELIHAFGANHGVIFHDGEAVAA